MAVRAQSKASYAAAMLLRGGSGWAVALSGRPRAFRYKASPCPTRLGGDSPSLCLASRLGRRSHVLASAVGLPRRSNQDALDLDQAPSQPIPKPWVIPVPKGTLQYIFGTSQVFRNFDDIKPKSTGLPVLLKIKEYHSQRPQHTAPKSRPAPAPVPLHRSYQQGHRCLEQEDWEVAVLFFSRALHLDSQMIEFYALRAEAYIQLCDFSSAAQNLRMAHASQPDNTNYLERLTLVLYLKGQCLFEQCAFLDALSVFSQASELQPEKACFRYRCMACLLALKRHHECLAFVTKEVKHGTTNADVYILRARLYNFFHKPKLCYQDLHSALLLDPKHPQAKVLLKVMVGQAQQARQDAGILAVQGKLHHALHCINCAIENNPLDPGLFLFRGTTYRRLREFDAAVEDLLKALDMMTEHQEDLMQQAQRQLLLAYNDFAVHCYHQGAYQESVQLLNKALKDEQQEKGLYINRGDCFFQLGNLTFAEADYQQALALSPKDEGAHLRMGLLQEKLGFWEQRSRQFQKAEKHFSMAIQHNPQKPQYYLYRARSRQFTQNIFGARQDVATVLLLDPEQPKLLPLMTNLFPGMSVEEVLGSQAAQLARLQLERVVEHSLWARPSQDIMGQLKERELERRKAQTLQFSWKLEQVSLEASKELEATRPSLRAKPEGPEKEAKAPAHEEKEAKLEPAPSTGRSLTDSYISQTSSGSTMGFRTTSPSETETSTLSWEYRSTSTTAGTSSTSSLLRTQASDLEGNGEDLSLSRSPRKPQASQSQSQGQRPSMTEAAQGQRERPSMTEAAQGQRERPSMTEAAQGQRERPSMTEAAQVQRERPSTTEAAQGQSQRPSKTETPQNQRPSGTEAAQGPRQKLTKTKATQGSRQRFRKAKGPHGWSWGLRKADQSWRLIQSPRKAFYDAHWSLRDSEATQGQGQGQRPSTSKAAQSESRSTSSGSSKTEVTWGLIPSLSNSQTARGLRQDPGPSSY
ncbi:tetratricopeptide repeat protein 16 isoform X3 [Phacochoerus africanus]|uniref:tetratricopeptide repeat protein 16 isoform X3 n=1 Tax=Phacochoerus africanus TaxID=41426 RepID=UPI001FD911A3|nr:tetratricopeptide repeat protein 16 isoform X3 [Phacochoerus africanus]